MFETLVPLIFPIFGAHVSGSKFQFSDLNWKDLCGMMANLLAKSEVNKGQLFNLVKAINPQIISEAYEIVCRGPTTYYAMSTYNSIS